MAMDIVSIHTKEVPTIYHNVSTPRKLRNVDFVCKAKAKTAFFFLFSFFCLKIYIYIKTSNVYFHGKSPFSKNSSKTSLLLKIRHVLHPRYGLFKDSLCKYFALHIITTYGWGSNYHTSVYHGCRLCNCYCNSHYEHDNRNRIPCTSPTKLVRKIHQDNFSIYWYRLIIP